MPEIRTCPICASPNADFASGRSERHNELIWDGTCPRCGEVRVTDEAIAKINGAGHSVPSQDRSYLLSAFFRHCGIGSTDQLVTTQNVETYLRDLPNYSPMEKCDLLIQHIAATTPRVGSRSDCQPDRDYSAIFAQDPAELQFYLRSLYKSDFLEYSPDLANYPIVLTLLGWQRTTALKNRGRTSARVFVAMSFDSSQSEIYDQGILPAIREAGYEAVRVDRTEHVNRIDDEIIALIRDCRFVVADFTQNRAGVYFEAGFGLGLGKRVIWICSRRDLNQLHFDTRQFNMIDYEMHEELRTRLRNRILALESKGPLSLS